MNRILRIALVALVAGSSSGCMFAVRHVAREANRSTVQSKAVKRFPAGTPIQTARTDLTASGYRCLDIPANGKMAAHVSCWPTKRTNVVEKFAIGGNWRYDLYAENAAMTKLHISSARHGMKRRKSARVEADTTAPTPVPPPPAL